MGSRVLTADHELDLLDTLRRLLGRCGYTCLTASSGSEALALMDAEAPDVVVTDLHPREAERQAHSVGGTLYLAKPFACADLVDTVARARAANPSLESGNGGTR